MSSHPRSVVVKPVVVLVTGLLALTVVDGLPASADPLLTPQFVYYSRSVPPHEVRAIVRSMGFDPVGGPLRDGRVYEQRAISPRGERVRVIIDARFGEVLAVRRVGEGYPYRGRDYSRWRRPPVEYYGDVYDRPLRPPAVMVERPTGYPPGPGAVIGPPPQAVPPGAGPRVIYGPADGDLKALPGARYSAPDRRIANLGPSSAARRPSAQAAKVTRLPLPRPRPNMTAAAQPTGATPMPRTKPSDEPAKPSDPPVDE
jgi:hypothetical protein